MRRSAKKRLVCVLVAAVMFAPMLALGGSWIFSGTYALYQKGNESSGPVAYMRISNHHGNSFTVEGTNANGQSTNQWRGQGTLQGMSGYYTWRFNDGRSGRTNFTIDSAGNLHGRVQGSGVSWSYFGQKSAARSQKGGSSGGCCWECSDQGVFGTGSSFGCACWCGTEIVDKQRCAGIPKPTSYGRNCR